jgi:hypothetical protein
MLDTGVFLRTDPIRYQEAPLSERLGAASDPSSTLDLPEYHLLNFEAGRPESLLAR